MIYLVKIVLTAVLVVAVAELAKRNSLLGALLASIPLVSVLGMVWLYIDTGDTAQVSALASQILWLVIPSLILFILLPLLLGLGWGFYVSLALSLAATVAGYGLTLVLLHYFSSAP